MSLKHSFKRLIFLLKKRITMLIYRLMNQKFLKRIHVVPNLITAFGLSCGLFAIFKMNMTSPGDVTVETLMYVSGLLLLSALADVLDGAVARAIKAESDFGTLFDSLADAITFGVAPAVIILKSLSVAPGSFLSFFVITGAMVYSVCGVLRLVRFNVMGMRSKDDAELVEAGKKNFTGLPIPAAAAAAVSANLFLFSNEMKSLVTLADATKAWILCAIMIVLAYFMVSRWKFLSLKTLRIRVGSFRLVFLTALCAVFILYGIVNHFPVVFFVVSWAYLIVAWILSIVRLIAGKKLKTLEDFEPAEEEPFDDQD